MAKKSASKQRERRMKMKKAKQINEETQSRNEEADEAAKARNGEAKLEM